MHSRIEADGLFELTATLVSASANLDKFLTKHGFTSLSPGAPAPNVELSKENSLYFDSRNTIVEAAEQIIKLVRGPRDVLLDISFQHCSTASLQVILKYKFANHIPLHGATTYEKIAKSVGKGMTPAFVERIIQHTSSYGLFTALPQGHVAHSPESALLVTDPDLEAWLYLNACIAYPAGASIPRAIEEYGVSSEANEAAYGVSIGRKISQFARFREKDGGHEMFAMAMRGISAGGAYDFKHAVHGGYPWHLLQEGAGHLVVDVGGGPGHVAMALAEKYHDLRFEVQDLPETVEVGAKKCPEELKKRVAFRAHDFMTPQPKHIVAGDESIAYFCRFILHDWSDKYATEILQQLAYGLRPQDRIILNEVVVPDSGLEPREVERRMHDRDMLMLMNLNGRERTQSAFEAMFSSVSPKLRLQKIHKPETGELSLIEVVLDSQAVGLNTNGITNGAHTNGTNGVNGVNGVNGDHDKQESNGLRFVDTVLNYRLDPSKGGDEIIYGGTVGEKRRKYQPCPAKIHDMRGHENEFSLDTHGFQIVHHPSVEKAFDNEERVNDIYHKECAEIVKKATGASRVFVISHLTRRFSWDDLNSSEKDKGSMERTKGFSTARFVHCDQSYNGARRRLGIDFPEEAEELSKSRWAIINIWRPIETIKREPLCLMDARSVPESQVHETKHIIPIPGNPLENLMWTFNPPEHEDQHKWYYLSNMTPDEVILLKIFDSNTPARRTPHTAFTSGEDSGPPRQSLEARLFVFWEDQPAEN